MRVFLTSLLFALYSLVHTEPVTYSQPGWLGLAAPNVTPKPIKYTVYDIQRSREVPLDEEIKSAISALIFDPQIKYDERLSKALTPNSQPLSGPPLNVPFSAVVPQNIASTPSVNNQRSVYDINTANVYQTPSQVSHQPQQSISDPSNGHPTQTLNFPGRSNLLNSHGNNSQSAVVGSLGSNLDGNLFRNFGNSENSGTNKGVSAKGVSDIPHMEDNSRKLDRKPGNSENSIFNHVGGLHVKTNNAGSRDSTRESLGNRSNNIQTDTEPYRAQSKFGQLDPYEYKQLCSDPRPFKRTIRTCSPTGQCETIRLGPEETVMRSHFQKVLRECEGNGVAKKPQVSQAVVYYRKGKEIRPHDRRVTPYSEVAIKQYPFN